MLPACPRRLRILLRSAGLAALGLATLSLHVPGSPAAEAYARFSVSATVEPHASLVIRGAPDALTLTAADIARGYLDLPQPIALRVQSNSRRGYVLTVSNSLPGLAGLRLEGLGDPVSLEAGGGSIAEHWTTLEHTAELTLRLRLLLDAAVTPGTYPWPLRLSAAAL